MLLDKEKSCREVKKKLPIGSVIPTDLQKAFKVAFFIKLKPGTLILESIKQAEIGYLQAGFTAEHKFVFLIKAGLVDEKNSMHYDSSYSDYL